MKIIDDGTCRFVMKCQADNVARPQLGNRNYAFQQVTARSLVKGTDENRKKITKYLSIG